MAFTRLGRVARKSSLLLLGQCQSRGQSGPIMAYGPMPLQEFIFLREQVPQLGSVASG